MTDHHTEPPGTPWQQRRTPVNAIRTAIDATLRQRVLLTRMSLERQAPFCSALLISWGIAFIVLLSPSYFLRLNPPMASLRGVIIFAACTLILPGVFLFNLPFAGLERRRLRFLWIAWTHLMLVWPMLTATAAALILMRMLVLSAGRFNAPRLKAEAMTADAGFALATVVVVGAFLHIAFAWRLGSEASRRFDGPKSASGSGFCDACDYDMRGLPPDAPCPECGTQYGAEEQPDAHRNSNAPDAPNPCESCGHSLTGLPDDAICPDCGIPVIASDLDNRCGTPWQRGRTPVNWIKTAVLVATHPAGLFRNMRRMPRPSGACALLIGAAFPSGVLFAMAVAHSATTSTRTESLLPILTMSSTLWIAVGLNGLLLVGALCRERFRCTTYASNARLRAVSAHASLIIPAITLAAAIITGVLSVALTRVDQIANAFFLVLTVKWISLPVALIAYGVMISVGVHFSRPEGAP